MLKQHCQMLDTKTAAIKATIDRISHKLQSDLQLKVKALKANEAELLLTNTARETLLKISAHKKEEMKTLQKIVNSGLKFIYPHKDLIFTIRHEEKRGKIEPEFWINDIELKDPFKGEGGGVITTISLLLFIASSSIKGYKIILLDETIKMVDLEASTRFVDFLEHFSKNKGVKILMITHKNFDFNTENITDKIKMIRR